GMMCNHCKAAVERGIAAVAGVDSVEVDLARGIARVAGNVDAPAVVAAVERLGYECAEE
ncbi:MAG: cation transporter, partial [Alistipes sp.]|nr:cation transporter [Alistipes sp.]